jgi:hypothetical protein
MSEFMEKNLKLLCAPAADPGRRHFADVH